MARYIGKGTKLYIENDGTPGQWDELCFVEMTPAEPEWSEAETTDSCTTGKDRTFISALKDNGTVSFVCNFDDAATPKTRIDDLRDSFDAGEERNFRIDHEQLTTQVRESFTGFIKKFHGPHYSGMEATLQYIMDVRITGAITTADI